MFSVSTLNTHTHAHTQRNTRKQFEMTNMIITLIVVMETQVYTKLYTLIMCSFSIPIIPQYKLYLKKAVKNQVIS